VVGAGLDGFMQHRVGASAKREFPPARPAVSAPTAVGQVGPA